MRYRLTTGKEKLDFTTYQDLLAGLQPIRRNLDGMYVEEIDDEGNVHSTLSNDDLRQVMREMDAIVLPTVLPRNRKDT